MARIDRSYRFCEGDRSVGNQGVGGGGGGGSVTVRGGEWGIVTFREGVGVAGIGGTGCLPLFLTWRINSTMMYVLMVLYQG